MAVKQLGVGGRRQSRSRGGNRWLPGFNLLRCLMLLGNASLFTCGPRKRAGTREEDVPRCAVAVLYQPCLDTKRGRFSEKGLDFDPWHDLLPHWQTPGPLNCALNFETDHYIILTGPGKDPFSGAQIDFTRDYD